jgi:phage terminase large subunit
MQSTYETSDLGCASTLLAHGAKIQSIDRGNQRRIVFTFTHDTEDLETIAHDYFLNREFSIAPLKLFGSQKQLKALIYS